MCQYVFHFEKKKKALQAEILEIFSTSMPHFGQKASNNFSGGKLFLKNDTENAIDFNQEKKNNELENLKLAGEQPFIID